ncbi:MAG: hypothetical protein ACYCZ0_04450 [Minisyncoccota bacterium]
MIAAASVFFASLTGLSLLFGLKAIESKRGNVFLPRVRSAADDAALSLKSLLTDLRIMLSKLPPACVYLSRIALHKLALGSAQLARLAEAQSHKVADLVSHKRGFEKREPRSDFLKQVGERNDVDSGLDTK